MLRVASLLVTLVVATSADPYSLRQDWKSHGESPLTLLNPFLLTEAGNEYIFVMVDSFTKWVECVPLSSKTAELTARAAINAFFVRFV